MYKISDEIKKCIVELKLKGFNYNQIKEKVGVSKGSISSILKEYDLSQKAPVIITEDLITQIQKKYDEVKNIKIVAKEFNISYERLAKIAILKRTKLKKSNYDTTKENRYKKKEIVS